MFKKKIPHTIHHFFLECNTQMWFCSWMQYTICFPGCNTQIWLLFVNAIRCSYFFAERNIFFFPGGMSRGGYCSWHRSDWLSPHRRIWLLLVLLGGWCVCARESERERQRERYMRMVCVCERERAKEKILNIHAHVEAWLINIWIMTQHHISSYESWLIWVMTHLSSMLGALWLSHVGCSVVESCWVLCGWVMWVMTHDIVTHHHVSHDSKSHESWLIWWARWVLCESWLIIKGGQLYITRHDSYETWLIWVMTHMSQRQIMWVMTHGNMSHDSL